MESDTYQQILNLIDKNKRILLLTHAKADCDGLGGMLAMHSALKDIGKEVTSVTNDPTPENLHFLPFVDIVQNSFSSSKDFIITLDLSSTQLNKIKYNLEDNRVNIIITPKSGAFAEKDVSFSQGGANYDLVIVFDTGNLEHLGPIYDQNTELFFNTPVINIDHHTSNTDFGQINLVNVVASSTTEVLFGLMQRMEKKYNKKFITEDIATLLLAGIITDTGSFQHANTSPKSMEIAAQLIDLGARQQEIIKNIYKTKKLSTLKLWGMVLSGVQVDPLHRMVWSAISKEDLQEANAESQETGDIIDDLLTNAPGAEVVFLIKYNEGGYISVSMRSTSNQIDVGKLCAEMGGGGHTRAAGFKVRDGRPFDQIASEVIAKVRDFQAKRLNIHEEDLKMPEKIQPSKKPEEESLEKHKKEKNEGKMEEKEKIEKDTNEKPTTPQQKKTTYMDFRKPKKGKPKRQEGVAEKSEVTKMPAKGPTGREQPKFIPKKEAYRGHVQHKIRVEPKKEEKEKTPPPKVPKTTIGGEKPPTTKQSEAPPPEEVVKTAPLAGGESNNLPAGGAPDPKKQSPKFVSKPHSIPPASEPTVKPISQPKSLAPKPAPTLAPKPETKLEESRIEKTKPEEPKKEIPPPDVPDWLRAE